MPVSRRTVATQIVFVPDRVLDLLHDHVPGVGVRVRGRKDHVAAERWVATRLAQHPQAQVVAVLGEVAHLLVHRGAGDVEDPAHDDAPRLPARVRVDRLDHPGEAHR
jgi:hypothetical protein